jgi:prepilin-type processing-associated H-X9-DG protein
MEASLMPSHILGSELAVSGGQAGANIWYLDGNINAAQGVDNAVVNPPPDAVSDFQAVTNGFAAEYGRADGAFPGAVNALRSAS